MSWVRWCYDADIASPALEAFQARRGQMIDLYTVKFHGSSFECATRGRKFLSYFFNGVCFLGICHN